MEKWLQKKCIAAAIPAFLLGAGGAVAAQLLMRNLWAFLSFDPQFQQIFAQLATARIRAPGFLLALIAYPFVYLLLRFCRDRRVMAGLGILLWLILSVIGALVSKVNDVLFLDVLCSLLDVLARGGLG